MKSFSDILKLPLRALLALGFVRRRIIFELRQRHYADLHITVPIGRGIRCPISFHDAKVSFEQIFFESEYEPAFRRIPLPARWLDLGCHAGYFSLYVAWRRIHQGLSHGGQALLVDGDARVEPAVTRLITDPGLRASFQFRHGAISAAPGEHDFAVRDQMNSGMADIAAASGPTRPVTTLGADEILRLLPPPYDLVKLDIEGGEYDFFTAYQPVIAQTNALLLEWHSWHPGGGGRDQIHQLAEGTGFELDAEIVAAQPVPRGAGTGHCGVLLYQRKGAVKRKAAESFARAAA